MTTPAKKKKEIHGPKSLRRPISPPAVMQRKRRAVSLEVNEKSLENEKFQKNESKISNLAAIEAGKATISDHLSYFSHHLSTVIKTQHNSRLSISDYISLYKRNSHPHGHHFVIHQHNHPVAGCHYDLRLQFSESSTVSFAIPYGLPGNPNSRHLGRIAIETRVHTIWNNLIESASLITGSLIIWDTGEYEVLPRKVKGRSEVETDNDEDSVDNEEVKENEKFIEAFKSRYIRLRLHGTRLPKGYTMTLRLPLKNDTMPPSKQPRKQKPRKQKEVLKCDATDSASDTLDPVPDEPDNAVVEASDAEDETSSIRLNNAYTGANNTIGSIHQRHWFITFDKANSGLVNEDGIWVHTSSTQGFEPFVVRGAEVETSIITGRTSAEVMKDEGVEGFKQRKMWRAILE